MCPSYAPVLLCGDARESALFAAFSHILHSLKMIYADSERWLSPICHSDHGCALNNADVFLVGLIRFVPSL